MTTATSVTDARPSNIPSGETPVEIKEMQDVVEIELHWSLKRL